MPSESDYMADAIVRAGLPGEVFRAELAAVERDPALIASPACPTCDGLGRIEVQHPSWGARWCPEPYIEVTCPTCGRGDAA